MSTQKPKITLHTDGARWWAKVKYIAADKWPTTMTTIKYDDSKPVVRDLRQHMGGERNHGWA